MKQLTPEEKEKLRAMLRGENKQRATRKEVQGGNSAAGSVITMAIIVPLVVLLFTAGCSALIYHLNNEAIRSAAEMSFPGLERIVWFLGVIVIFLFELGLFVFYISSRDRGNK